MTARALVMGSQVGELRGVSNDVGAMSQWLQERGFAVDVRERADATREGMLEGLRRLAGSVRRSEPVVIYYSGHGGAVATSDTLRLSTARHLPRAFQYLVPTDHDKKAGRFRGIFQTELSAIVQKISIHTANITVLLDSCYSTGAVRDEGLVVKSVVEPWTEGIEKHVRWLEQEGYQLGRLSAIRNPALVLVSACEAARRAFECCLPSGESRGLFTDSLLHVLRNLPDPRRASWASVLALVRVEVARTTRSQRPQVTGPARRRLFSEEEVGRCGELAVAWDRNRWCLRDADTLAVEVGDRFQIVDGDNNEVEAEVTALDGGAAYLDIEQGADLDGAIATPAAGGPPRYRCCLRGQGPHHGELAADLRKNLSAELVEDPSAATLLIDVDGEEVRLVEPNMGRLLRSPWTFGRDTYEAFLDELRGILRASALLAFAKEREDSEASAFLAHEIEWGRVEGGRLHPLARIGEELSEGDRIYIRVNNICCKAQHISVFDVGVGRTVTQLNRNEPEGIDLEATKSKTFGGTPLRAFEGMPLSWPANVPRTGPMEESVVIFVSRGPLPVRAWETHSTSRPTVPRRGTPPALQETHTPKFVVRTIRFSLRPQQL